MVDDDGVYLVAAGDGLCLEVISVGWRLGICCARRKGLKSRSTGFQILSGFASGTFDNNR